MQPDPQSVLAELKAKREVRSPALHFRDCWRTYGLMVLYGAGLLLLDFGPPTRGEGILVFPATVIIIGAAVSDGQRALNRRFEILVDLLEKKGGL